MKDKSLSKDQKKARDNLERISNKILTQFSFGGIKSYNDLLRASGLSQSDIHNRYFPSEYNKIISRGDVQDFLSDKRIELTTKQWLENNPPDTNHYEERNEQNLQVNQQNGESIKQLDEGDNKDRSIVISNKVKDYGFTKSPNDPQETYFAVHQKKAIVSISDNLFNKHYRGQYLIGQGGSGKTWVFGEIFRQALDRGFAKEIGSVSPWPYILVTKSSVVEKTSRDLRRYFNIKVPQEVLVIGIDSLRAKFGELFVEEVTEVENGVEHTFWKWREFVNPCLIVWDEGHVLKNYSSQQHQIACSYNELDNTYQIFSSATPLSKVQEGKCFAVSTRIVNNIATIEMAPLNNSTWTIFAKNISAPAKPHEYAPEAVRRFREVMEPFIVEMKGVRPQFHAINKVKMIPFTTTEGKIFYQKAEDTMIAKLNKIKSSDSIEEGKKYLHQLSAIIAYRIAAESNPDMISYMCENAYNDVAVENKAAVFGVCFTDTIIASIKYLVYKKNVPRSLISIIWGGATKQPTDKQKAKAIIEVDPEIQKVLKEMGMTIEDLGLEDTKAQLNKEILPDELRLGPQTRKERQREIDRFQTGKTLFCFYTFRAGGTGLSLHHTDEWTVEKCRRKESGYAYEEDIPKIPTRQRKTYVTPTWSPPELVQGVCRAPRLTSLSDTEQELVFFQGTIQEQVAHKVSMGLASLGQMVRQKESWIGFAVGDALVHINKKNDNDTDEDDESYDDIYVEDSTNDNKQLIV
jgi:hypothetical protein